MQRQYVIIEFATCESEIGIYFIVLHSFKIKWYQTYDYFSFNCTYLIFLHTNKFIYNCRLQKPKFKNDIFKNIQELNIFTQVLSDYKFK